MHVMNNARVACVRACTCARARGTLENRFNSFSPDATKTRRNGTGLPIIYAARVVRRKLKPG